MPSSTSTPKTKTSRRRPTQSQEVAEPLAVLLPFPCGQPLANALLASAVAQHRLPSAYLFTGPKGVGKVMAARWLAAQILWQCCQGESDISQGAFLSQIQARNYPDLLWVEPTYLVNGTLIPQSAAGLDTTGTVAIRMEQALALRQTLQGVALRGRWVVVIEEVDYLTNEAGNALLKLLEDRLNCTFILTSSQPDQVMNTIRSRAQAVPFNLLEQTDYQAVVAQSCPDLMQYPTLLAYGAGSPGQAISTYQALCKIPAEVAIDSFQPTNHSAGILKGMRAAKHLSSLPTQVQLALLGYLQYELQDRKVRDLIEQAITLLNSRAQAQATWELLLCQCAIQGIGWTIHLPAQPTNDNPPDKAKAPDPEPEPVEVEAPQSEAGFQQVSLF